MALTRKEKYKLWYTKLQIAAKELNRKVSSIRLGQPEYKCECPACCRVRRISRNNKRKLLKSKLKPEPLIKNLPIIRNCPCEFCSYRRQYCKQLRDRRKNGTH